MSARRQVASGGPHDPLTTTGRLRILLVEDSESIRAFVRGLLKRAGHSVLTAANGEQGLESFRRDRPDLVLMDILMPGMDGFETTSRIRELEAGASWTPIIFLTGMSDEENARRGVDVGGDDYLVKPVHPVMLGAKIKAMSRLWEMRRELDMANRELQRLATHDGLTELANRRHFDDSLALEWRRAGRSRTTLSLLLIDVDRFKAYNDTLGHPAGDDCLRHVARALRTTLRRPGDLVARYGGEEFAVLLPDTPLSGALRVAETLRAAVEALDIPHPGMGPNDRVTVSIGVASDIGRIRTGHERIVTAADRMLYLAKGRGRNRVCGAGHGGAAEPESAAANDSESTPARTD